LLLERNKLRKLRSLLAAATHQAPKLACCCNATSSESSGAYLLLQRIKLRSLLAVATQQAPEDLRLRSLLAAAATKPCNATSSGASLAVEEKEEP